MKRKTIKLMEKVRNYFEITNKKTMHLYKDEFNELLEYFSPLEQSAFRIDGKINFDGKQVVRK